MKATDDPFVNRMQGVIHGAVRVMALLMTFVIIMGVLDVLWILYVRLMSEPRFLLKIGDILATFGGFMAVLIAIEIFVNITIYLRDDVIHVKIVVATALMAIARKIIVLDLKETPPEGLYGLAAIMTGTGLVYWLVATRPLMRRGAAATHDAVKLDEPNDSLIDDPS